MYNDTIWEHVKRLQAMGYLKRQTQRLAASLPFGRRHELDSTERDDKAQNRLGSRLLFAYKRNINIRDLVVRAKLIGEPDPQARRAMPQGITTTQPTQYISNTSRHKLPNSQRCLWSYFYISHITVLLFPRKSRSDHLQTKQIPSARNF